MTKYIGAHVSASGGVENVKYILSFLMVIVMTTFVSSAQEVRSNSCTSSHLESVSCHDYNAFEHGDWVLVFEDDFNGNELDTSKWYTCEDGWNRFHGVCGSELQCYLDDNISVNNGILNLVAKRDIFGIPRPNCNEILYYSSGWIQTKTKFKYGLIEAKCKVPEGKGFWPAFWLYGHSTEIDIFEIYGNETDNVHTDMHNWNGNHRHCPKESLIDNVYNDYHVYRIEWDEFKIIISVDGHIIREQYKYTNILGQSVPDRYAYVNNRYIYALDIFPDSSQSIIFNLAISNSIEHPCPDNTTLFPSSLDIDYIRVFKRNNENMDLSISSYKPDSINYITGRSIHFSNNSGIEIQNEEYLNCIATHEIIIQPEFQAKLGSEFSATINPLPARRPDLNMQYTIDSLSNPIITNNDVLLNINPNPSNRDFSISLTNKSYSIEDVIIEDCCGRIVYTNTRIGKTELHISLYKPGLYYAHVRTNNNITILKKILIK